MILLNYLNYFWQESVEFRKAQKIIIVDDWLILAGADDQQIANTNDEKQKDEIPGPAQSSHQCGDGRLEISFAGGTI